MKEDIEYLKEQIVKMAEWEVYNNYLLQVLLFEKLGTREAKRVIKKCQKLTKETFEEENDETI